MKRVFLAALIAVLCIVPAFSAGGYFSLGVGPDTGFKAWSILDGDSTEMEYYQEDTRIGGDLDVSIGFRACDWFSLGLATGINYSKPVNGMLDYDIIVPFMAEFVFEPTTGSVRFPVKLQAGGHAEFTDDDSEVGAAFGVSAGVAVDVSESFSIGYAVKFNLLMQFDEHDFTRLRLNMVPIALDMTYRF